MGEISVFSLDWSTILRCQFNSESIFSVVSSGRLIDIGNYGLQGWIGLNSLGDWGAFCAIYEAFGCAGMDGSGVDAVVDTTSRPSIVFVQRITRFWW